MPPPRSALAAASGHTFGRLHATGWRFRDPRGDNLRARGENVLLVDLDGLAPTTAGRHRASHVADLGRLLAWARFQTPALELSLGRLIRCFLRAYLRERRQLGRPVTKLRRFAQAITRRAERWHRRHAKG